MDSNLKRTIILDNYQNPTNRQRHDNEESYKKINTRNVSCIDNLDIYLKINNNIIEDITFEGEACVISISTTSIMINKLIGKNINDAIKIIENYLLMIEEKEYDSNLLGEACAYHDISKQPSRKKCATLSWNGLYQELLKIKDNA